MRFNFYSQEIRGRRGFFAAARKVFLGSVLLGKAEWALVKTRQVAQLQDTHERRGAGSGRHILRGRKLELECEKNRGRGDHAP